MFDQERLQDAWVINLQNTNEVFDMFNRKEAEFILDNSVMDMKNITGNIEFVTAEIARLGKNLSEMLETKNVLATISKKLAEALEEECCESCS